GLEVGIAVVRQDGDPAADLQTRLIAQTSRQTGDAVADLAPGAATLAVDGGGARRSRDDGANEALGDSHRKGCSCRLCRREILSNLLTCNPAPNHVCQLMFRRFSADLAATCTAGRRGEVCDDRF